MNIKCYSGLIVFQSNRVGKSVPPDDMSHSMINHVKDTSFEFSTKLLSNKGTTTAI